MNESTKPLSPGPPAAILIVDDEPPLRDILAQLLSGYHVATADNGRSAVDMLKQAHYALVITDLMMPQVDGFTVLRTAKQIDATTEVLVITGYPSAENERRCREMGCFDVVAKPFSMAAVRDRVDRCLNKKQRSARPA
ncbi:MAG: response regulator [Candidatus Zixiibacteriota bacterium]